jgi:hypothetical protein
MSATLVPETTGLLVDQRQLAVWLNSGTPGAKLCYFIGHLARTAANDVQVAVVQKMTIVASRNERIALTQKRVGDEFEYYATMLWRGCERAGT